MTEPVILVTGFEPFNGAAVNPSAELINRLAAETPAHVRLYTATLPVVSQTAADLLKQLLAEIQPDALLSLGEARGRSAINIEQQGFNELNFRIPDNSGVTITDQPIVRAGPACYSATFPAQAIRDAIRENGIPAVLSDNAGRYLCNQILYQGLHWAATTRPLMLCGFIHLPSLPEQMAHVDEPKPTMALSLQVAAMRTALVVIAEAVRHGQTAVIS
jgi:pyroglutamyl-peptidase